MKFNKRTKLFGITTSIILLITAICVYRFDEDSSKLFKMRNEMMTKGGKYFMSHYHDQNDFSNPLIRAYFYFYKQRFSKRFVDQSESFVDQTDNQILKDIISFYRDYWTNDFMKSQDDTLDHNYQLIKNLGQYLIDHQLTRLSIEEINSMKDISKDLKASIEKEGAYCQFFYLNEKHDIMIWATQNREIYTIETPYETRDIPVIFFEDVILSNRADFLSFGSKRTGGWPNNAEGVIYSGDYDIESEQFKYSFLTHEANHFFDNEKYPNLSAADLEYRSKLIELIYVEKDEDRMLREFLAGASNENRNHGHPYGNYQVIKDLSSVIFNKSFEGNYSIWKTVPVETINEAALKLFELNEEKLQQNPKAEFII